MKKPMSKMTPQQFVEYAAGIGGKYFELAAKLKRSHSTVSQYSTGKLSVPLDVAQELEVLLAARAVEIHQQTGRLHAANAVGELIIENNLLRQKREGLHSTELTLARRLRPPDTSTYPVYRLTLPKMTLYRQALKQWAIECDTRLRTRLDDKRRIQMHRLELYDIKALIELAPKNAPYDVCITRTEWDVVARALRWLYKQDPVRNASAYALYQHWRRNKGSGYPRVRTTPPTQPTATAP